MKISEIKKILNAIVLTREDQLDRNVVGAGGADLMADVLPAADCMSMDFGGWTVRGKNEN